MTKQNYIIVEAYSPKRLQASVNALKAEGYMPVNNDNTAAHPYQLGGSRLYLQAMVLTR